MYTENNKIIAEFMGFDFSRFANDGIIEPQEDIFFTDSKTFTLEELKFHSDWNWLMEVVEKIEEIENIRFNVETSQDTCRIYDCENFEDIVNIEYADTKIQAVYQAVVAFINWHNQQNH